MRYFFYGTLLDDEVRAAVTGGERLACRPTVLRGWTRVRVPHATYPVLRPQPGGSVTGILTRAVAAATAARLRRYEGAEYREARLPVHVDGDGVVTAAVFVPRSGTPTVGPPWDLATWVRLHKPGFLRRHGIRPLPATRGRAGLDR